MAVGVRHYTSTVPNLQAEYARFGSSSVKSMISARPTAVSPSARNQSLVFQLEIDCKELPKPLLPPQLAQRNVHDVLDRIEQLLRPDSTFAARLARDVQCCHDRIVDEEGCADVVILASSLAGFGYAVTIRTAIGGGSGVSAFKHLSHIFLVVAGPDPDGFHYIDCPEYIVDPRFREQFDISKAVAWYKDVLHSIPEVYVGIAPRLRPLVRLLSSEMAAAFSAAGAVTPPWRSSASLLSKWLPKVSRDRSSSTESLIPAASLPSRELGRASSLLQSDSTPLALRHDFQLPSSTTATTQQLAFKCSGEKLASQRFGSSRFDASVPAKPILRRGGSNTGGSIPKEASARSASCVSILNMARKSTGGTCTASPEAHTEWLVGTNKALGSRAAVAVAPDVGEARERDGIDLAAAVQKHSRVADKSSLPDPGIKSSPASRTATAVVDLIKSSAPDRAFQTQKAQSSHSCRPGTQARQQSRSTVHEASPSDSAAARSTSPPKMAPAPAHLQTLLQPDCRSDPIDATDHNPQNSDSRQPLSDSLTSVLSRKLARMRSSAEHTAPPVAAVSSKPQTMQMNHPQIATRQIQHQPSIHAPFWDEPLIVDYIAKQQPGGLSEGNINTITSAHPSQFARSLDRTPSELATAFADASSCQPRIRKVKMRGTIAVQPKNGTHRPH